jgi:beta-galactosidase/beta-glucuronidase
MVGGIYGEAYIGSCDIGRIDYVTTDQIRKGENWELAVTVEYFAYAAGQIPLEISIAEQRVSSQISVDPGENTFREVLEIPNPELWWPMGYGDQALYSLTVRAGEHRIEKKIGFQSEVFYELCDEKGLLVWQDFMFGCSTYPATEWFLEGVEGEVRYQVKRLKDHPCIAVWCGNNENLGALNWYAESRAHPARYLVDYDRLNEGVVGRIVRQLDPGRPWWPSSPSAGEGDYSDNWHDDTKGDMHYWSVWHEGKNFEAYYEVTPRWPPGPPSNIPEGGSSSTTRRESFTHPFM